MVRPQAISAAVQVSEFHVGERDGDPIWQGMIRVLRRVTTGFRRARRNTFLFGCGTRRGANIPIPSRRPHRYSYFFGSSHGLQGGQTLVALNARIVAFSTPLVAALEKIEANARSPASEYTAAGCSTITITLASVGQHGTFGQATAGTGTGLHGFLSHAFVVELRATQSTAVMANVTQIPRNISKSSSC